MADIQPGNIVPVYIEDEIRDSYMAYAMSVIVGRALPDVRDGLKPVHRRILFAMHEMGNAYNRPHKKSARVVGNVIGKYHPHGDSAVYDALVRLAQPFNMQVPLVDGQGNFGSVDGDPPAAMRYTEARLAKICNEILADIDKDTVDHTPNYDESELEPSVLPTKVPNLLVNGSSGIAVGMSTNIPPHNLKEVMDAVIHLMANPQATIAELMHFIPGPDFPTAASIYGRQGIVDAYHTGTGSIRIRARTEVEDNVNGKEAIIITELPYQVNKARLIEKIAQLVKEKRIEGIHDLRDESDRRGMRIVVEIKRDASPEIILNQLFKQTPMQTAFRVNLLAIVNGQPRVLNLKEIIAYFIEFRRDVTIRRTIFLLRKANERAHILEGLKIALDNLDAIIKLIRESETPAAAKRGLVDTFALSEIQAQAILDMRLQRLTGLERDKILEELRLVRLEIARLEEILNSRTRLDQVITDELAEVRDSYAIPRRTDILEEEADINIEDLIADEDMIVTISHQNYIKRLPLAEYRAQKRGGRGKIGMHTKEDDFVRDLFVASAHQRIFVFTSLGRVFQLKVYELPLSQRTTRGRPIIHLLPRLEENESIAAVLPIPRNEDEFFVVTATQSATLKKTALSAFSNINVAGLRAVNFKEGDNLVAARIVKDDETILLASNNGMSIRFDQSDLRAMGRSATGVRGMRLRQGDTLIAMEVIRDPRATLLTVTQNGFGKRTALDEHRLQTRGGIGIITIKTSERNGAVVNVLQVHDDDHLLIVTDRGNIIRTRVNEIRESGRNTMGVKLIRTEETEHVVALARIVDPDDDFPDEDLGHPPIDTNEMIATENNDFSQDPEGDTEADDDLEPEDDDDDDDLDPEDDDDDD